MSEVPNEQPKSEEQEQRPSEKPKQEPSKEQLEDQQPGPSPKPIQQQNPESSQEPGPSQQPVVNPDEEPARRDKPPKWEHYHKHVGYVLQQENHCGAHALNMILQVHEWEPYLLMDIAIKLEKEEKLRGIVPERPEDKHYDGTGNYSLAVLENALKPHCCTLTNVNAESVRHYRDDPDSGDAYLFHTNRHWWGCRKIADTDWYVLDSMAVCNRPIPLSTEQFVHLFEMTLLDPSNSIFVLQRENVDRKTKEVMYYKLGDTEACGIIRKKRKLHSKPREGWRLRKYQWKKSVWTRVKPTWLGRYMIGRKDVLPRGTAMAEEFMWMKETETNTFLNRQLAREQREEMALASQRTPPTTRVHYVSTGSDPLTASESVSSGIPPSGSTETVNTAEEPDDPTTPRLAALKTGKSSASVDALAGSRIQHQFITRLIPRPTSYVEQPTQSADMQEQLSRSVNIPMSARDRRLRVTFLDQQDDEAATPRARSPGAAQAELQEMRDQADQEGLF